MQPFFDDFLERLTALHRSCLNSMDGLSVQALDWVPVQKPTAEMNSISILITHLVGAERYWIGDVALGENSGRVREQEFRVHGLSAEELIDKITAASDYARTALTKLTFDDLDRLMLSSRDGKEYTIAWALLHALEHTALHVGHLQLVSQLWDEQVEY
jgi:uncharacterized damage-inducible protein DinB